MKRVKIEEKLLWRAYRNSPTIFRTLPPPTPYGILFPKIGGSQPPPKTSIAIISETGKKSYSDFKFGRYIHSVHQNIKNLNFREKERVRIQGLPKVLKYPLLSQAGKATNFVVRTFIRSIATIAH